MYFNICYRGRVWNPCKTCVIIASIYGDYSQGDHSTPCGTEDFGGVTVINKVTRDFVREAVERGAVVYANLPDIAIKGALDVDLN